MTRTVRSTALIAASIAASGLAVTAARGVATNSGSELRLVATPQQSRMIDQSPRGDSIGDTALDVFRLQAPGAQHPTGRALNQCVLFVTGAKPLAQCTSSLVLRTGTLALAGVSTGTPRTIYAVTGGTGRYAGARGTASFTPGPRGISLAVHLVHR